MPTAFRSYNPNKPLISIHVPKCAGTSVQRVLEGWFKANYLPHYYSEKRQEMPPRYDLSAAPLRRLLGQKYRPGLCIHGHFNSLRGFGLQDYYPNADQFITVLRDPFEIAVSDYFYGKRQGDQRLVNGRPLPMSEQFANITAYFEEAITRPYIAHHLPAGITLDNYATILREKFVYAGIMEDLPLTIQIMAQRLGFPAVTLRHLNESPRDEEVPPAVKQAFIAAHPLDYALYHYARDHYRET